MRKKILIIEDEKVLGEMYREKFELEGFEVFSVSNVEEGLRVAKEKKPDLILLDILMPGSEDGISFLKRREGEKEILKIPVIAFSNYDDPETQNIALKLGAKEYLIKTSYTPQQLLEKIKNYLQ